MRWASFLVAALMVATFAGSQAATVPLDTPTCNGAVELLVNLLDGGEGLGAAKAAYKAGCGTLPTAQKDLCKSTFNALLTAYSTLRPVSSSKSFFQDVLCGLQTAPFYSDIWSDLSSLRQTPTCSKCQSVIKKWWTGLSKPSSKSAIGDWVVGLCDGASSCESKADSQCDIGIAKALELFKSSNRNNFCVVAGYCDAYYP